MQFVQIQHNPRVVYVGSYFHNWSVRGWRHKYTIDYGYYTAAFDIQAPMHVLDEFFTYGLGRRVRRYSPDGNICIYDGFVYDMVFQQPGMRSRKSIADLYNYAKVYYTELDTSTNPPGETAAVTPVAGNSSSVFRYGLKDLVYRPPVEKMTLVMAQQLRDTVLDQYRIPRRSDDYASYTSEPKISIVCRGFMDTLDWRVYNHTANSGTQNASLEIAAMEAAVGDFIEDTRISTNTLQVNRYTNDDLTALARIKTIAGMGDANDNRWVCMVWEDRILYYQQAASEVSYYRRLSDRNQVIRNPYGQVVHPWEIRPDNWLRTSDVTIYRPEPASLEDDESAMYIESVEWSEDNNTVVLSGTSRGKLQTIVARLANQGDYVL